MIDNRRHYDGLTEAQKIDRIMEQLDSLCSAFPYGIEDHKKTHIDLATAAKEEQEFIKDLKRTLAKNSIMGLLLFILSATVLGIAVKFGSMLKGVG